MTSPAFWQPKGARQVCFNPKEWTSTYSDLGKHSEVPPKASSPSVDADLRSAKEKAYTHKIWAREHLQSTYRTDMTTTLQHAMKGVTDSSLKPGADPRQVLKLARQLRAVAQARGRESRVGEALLALKQAKAMATSCIEAVQRGDHHKRRVGNKEVAVTIGTPKGEHSATTLDDVKGTPKHFPPGIERSAHELLLLITSDMLKMGVDGSRASTPQTPTITAGDKRATARGVASRGSESTDHDGSRSAPPRTKIASRRAPEEYLFGQISSSPISGYPNSNRYMTEQKKAALKAWNDKLKTENKALRVTRRGTFWLPLPSTRPPMTSSPNDLRTHIEREQLKRGLADAASFSTFTIKFNDSPKIDLATGLGNKKASCGPRQPEQVPETVFRKRNDGW